MSWDYKVSERALKQLKKLDKQAAAQILAYLDERIAGTHDPRQWGQAAQRRTEQHLALPEWRLPDTLPAAG